MKIYEEQINLSYPQREITNEHWEEVKNLLQMLDKHYPSAGNMLVRCVVNNDKTNVTFFISIYGLHPTLYEFLGNFSYKRDKVFNKELAITYKNFAFLKESYWEISLNSGQAARSDDLISCFYAFLQFVKEKKERKIEKIKDDLVLIDNISSTLEPINPSQFVEYSEV